MVNIGDYGVNAKSKREVYMLISVIIPVYNAETTIRKCLQSILDQSFKDVEVVLVNDGSEDGTLSILALYDHVSNLKVINQINLGEGGARNTGLLHCSGEYVLFLDSDDCLHEGFLDYVQQFILDKKPDLVFSSYTKSDHRSTERRYKFRYEFFTNDDLVKNYYRRTINIGIGNTLFKKSIIDERNLSFSDAKSGADNEFFRILALYCESSYSLPFFSFEYFVHPDSLMNKSFNLSRLDSIKTVLKTREFLKKNDQHPNYQDFQDYLDIFLISEVRGCYLSNLFSEFPDKKLYPKLLDLLPNKINLKVFFSHRRLFWLLYNLLFYTSPNSIKNLHLLTNKLKRRQ